jgi:hypothetical protein
MSRDYDRRTATRFGRSVDLPGALAGVTPNIDTVKRRVLLVEGNLNELWPDKWADAGSWVLTVSSSILEPAVAGAHAEITPLVCYITIGSGGATHKVQVDAWPGFSLSLPAAVVRAEVDWDSLPRANVIAPNIWAVPQRVRINATIQRSNVAASARRSFLLARDLAAGQITRGVIPPFAKSWMVWAPPFAPLHQVYANAASFAALWETDDLVGGRLTVGNTNAELTGNRAAGRELPVTGASTRWSVWVAAAESQVARIDFRVQL